MASIPSLFDVKSIAQYDRFTTTDPLEMVNIDGKEALFRIAQVLGALNDSDGLPNDARILYVSPGGDDVYVYSNLNNALAALATADAASARSENQKVIIQMAPGFYPASGFDYTQQKDVIVRGSGQATVIECTPSTFALKYINSANFSGNIRCGLESMRFVFTDDGTNTGHELAAIDRHPDKSTHPDTSAGLRECWFKDLSIDVGEVNTARTGPLWGIGYLGGQGTSTTETAWAMVMDNVSVISSNSGMVIGDGEWHFSGCNIWFSNTEDTSPPAAVGLDYRRGGRWYWQGGKITTGYSSYAEIESANPIYCVRCVGTSGSLSGRGYIWDAVMFARNVADSPGDTHAIYMNDSQSGDGWLRCFNCYIQAEGDTDFPAIDTDWHPENNNVNRIELYSCRVAGVNGNFMGDNGRITVSASATIQSNERATWYCDTDTAGADITLTLHSSASVNTDTVVIKNIGDIGASSYDVIVAVGDSSDIIDGVTNGTITIPPRGSLTLSCRELSSGNLQWETVGANYVTTTNDMFVQYPGALGTGQHTKVATVNVGANEWCVLEKIRYYMESGTAMQVDFQKNGNNMANAANIAVGTDPTLGTAVLNQGDGFDPINIYDSNRLGINVDSTTGGTDLNVVFSLRRTRYIGAE